ncbi:hypothetical protein OROMI_008981 [Orobanche minor]
MSTVTAISVLRSATTTARISTVRLTGGVKPRTAPSPFAYHLRRSPVEMSSISMVSMLPYHSATASAVLTSMLSVAPLGHGWSIEGERYKDYTSCPKCTYNNLHWEHDSAVHFAFVDPTSVPGDGDMSGNGRLIERLTNSTVDSIGHWILTIINDTKDKVYFLDSLGNRTRYDNWKSIMVSSFCDVVLCERLMHPSEKRWCPPLKNSRYDSLKQRPGTLECGFCVCRYMKEIIESDDPDLEKMVGGPVRDKYYSQAQYDEVLDDWSFVSLCLGIYA